ncbi:hypothetical protein [Paenibacillus flagellatus]|uniref:Uncharacterized protein n=1 Tax=Paenibacillus flagellatus TaxID=2211139 RepID=A0A2V5K3V6_9BACL|nr:hypothetical protein [Paenibacillus flagellatus]PYI53911.1 hypothetical protein DLM86_15265 [Paenibacillus flagellatus]
MIEKYALLQEPGKTMFVFAANGKFYGHIIKDRTDKAPAKFLFETPRYASVEALKAEYPPAESP